MIRRLKRQTKRRHSVRADWTATERRAEKARRDAAVAKILREGGSLVCGMRAYKRLTADAVPGLSGLFGVEIWPSAALPPDEVYAMARPNFELLRSPFATMWREPAPYYTWPNLP